MDICPYSSRSFSQSIRRDSHLKHLLDHGRQFLTDGVGGFALRQALLDFLFYKKLASLRMGHGRRSKGARTGGRG